MNKDKASLAPVSPQTVKPPEQQIRLTVDGCDVKLNFLSKETAVESKKLETVKQMILSGFAKT